MGMIEFLKKKKNYFLWFYFRTMAVELQEQLLHAIQKVFNYNRRQAETVYVELIVCMRKRQYITIYKMDDDDSTEQEDVDQAILRTLLR
jgi:transient receptor potential cation channel subfamily M protein 3